MATDIREPSPASEMPAKRNCTTSQPMAGVRLSSELKSIGSPRRYSWRKAGLGAVLIPGGNDTLLLVGFPGVAGRERYEMAMELIS